MTNPSKAVKATNPLRYLDLSFEGRQKAATEELNNGVKPHGGHRGRSKHPLSHLSFDKPRDYHEKLREDIDKLFEEEDLKVHGSPVWVCEANREVSHGGDSPLIVNKFLAASRVEPSRSVPSRKSAKSARNSKTPPPRKEGVLYYRPNRTHQYLTSTELKDYSQGESNIKYGRPTRTTLLRARQRSNSAPVNAYEVRREMMKRAEERRSKSYLNNKQDVLNIYAGFGESQHSWLIGARYNRAHYVDAKSFSLYGMYMPRNNPVGCFVTHSVKDSDEFSCPSAPPDTPHSDDGGEITSNYAQRVSSAPVTRKLYISSSPSTTKQAWGEATTSCAEVPRDCEAVKQNGEQDPEEVTTKVDGLNVKGSRLFAPRVESAKRPVLPTVQGTSWRCPGRRQTPENSVTSHPPPTTPMGLASSSQKDPTGSIKLEDLITKRSYSGRGPLSDKSPSEQSKDDHRLSAPKKIKPILVDRSVNVPSVSGDATQPGVQPQSGIGRVTGVAMETPQNLTTGKENGKQGGGNIGLDLELADENALLDPEVPINSPEGIAPVTSPCSDGNGSLTGNDALPPDGPAKANLSEVIMTENEAQKRTNDNVTFFITENGEEEKADDENSMGSKTELQNLAEDETKKCVEETDMRSNTNNAGNLPKEDNSDDVTIGSEKNTAENEDENLTMPPIIQVMVDYSRKTDQ